MTKRGFLILILGLTILFSSFSLAYTGNLNPDDTIPADAAYHELIYITNGNLIGSNYISIDANEDGILDTSERSIEGVHGSGIPNALMKFKTSKNATNSTIYELDGNVGFHIKNPTDTLQIMTGHIWNLGQNDAGIILRSGDEISNGINIVTSSNGDLSIQTRYNKKNYDSLFIKGDTRNIGIGITNPLRALDIRSDDGIHLEPSKLPNSPLAGDIAIDNKDKKLKWYDGKEWITMGRSTSLDADDGSPSDVVYVDSIGNVGIGTTSPGTKLEVNGDTMISGDTQITGQLIIQSDINMNSNYITNLADPQNAQDAATMNYVDTRIAAGGVSGPPAGFKWFTFGNTGRYLKEGARAYIYNVATGQSGGARFFGEARIKDGQLQTRAYKTAVSGCACDSGWINGDYASCCCKGGGMAGWPPGDSMIKVQAYEGGIRMKCSSGNPDPPDCYSFDPWNGVVWEKTRDWEFPYPAGW